MRKNFTQLFLGMGLLLGFVTMANAQCEIDPPPNSYFNYQFDGGLEGWRNLDAAGFESTVGFNWSETGDISMGAYGPPDGTTITSESQCNGAVVMDSDFLDNLGIPGNFGAGECPAPCNRYLQSPVMDFSTATEEIAIQFWQACRQFQSNFFIYVSLDGGLTNVDTITFNDDLVLNAATTQRLESFPLCGVRGESNVVVTFHYDANYYFLAIDDVSFVGIPETVDMQVNSNFFTKAPNYATPANMSISVPILADIQNNTAYDSPIPTLDFTVRDAMNNELFTDSRVYPSVPGCSTDENKLFDNQWMLPTEEGLYSTSFQINTEGDVDAENDVLTAPFRITDREFRRLPTEEEHGAEYISGFRYGSGFISWGSYFDIPNNDGNQAIESITLGYSTSTQDSVPEPGFVYISVYSFTDFNDNGDVEGEERLLLGEFQQIIPPNSPPDLTWTVTPMTENQEMIVPPAGGLLVVGHTEPFSGNTNYFFRGVDDDNFPEYSTSATQFANRLAGTQGGFMNFAAADSPSADDRHDRVLFNVDGGVNWDISVMLTPPTSTEEINEALSIDVFPSPASEMVNVDINLEEVSPTVSVELMDMAGNRAGMHYFKNVKKDRLTIDVSEIPGGMYLMNIRTEEGMISKKISVIH